MASHDARTGAPRQDTPPVCTPLTTSAELLGSVAAGLAVAASDWGGLGDGWGLLAAILLLSGLGALAGAVSALARSERIAAWLVVGAPVIAGLPMYVWAIHRMAELSVGATLAVAWVLAALLASAVSLLVSNIVGRVQLRRAVRYGLVSASALVP